MSQQAPRQFEDKPAVRERVPLLLGLVGSSGSGKTYSALRLAAGIQRVTGGEVFGIDTEADRMKHYADKFKFRHVPFAAPFGPLDYLAAIQHCVSRGAKVIVIDSMTHEHSGDGGVLDQIERNMGGQDSRRWTAQIEPKRQRKRLNNAIVQLGINAIFCYRAVDKTKPGAGGKPEHLGWTPETTSTLHYEMIQRFLLIPGCDGCPSFLPSEDAERRLVKNPEQFRNWFTPGVQLSEDIGQRLAEWAAGSPATGGVSPVDALLADFAACETAAQFAALDVRGKALWKSQTKAQREATVAARQAAEKRIAERPVSQPAGEPDGHLFGVDEDQALDAQAR